MPPKYSSPRPSNGPAPLSMMGHKRQRDKFSRRRQILGRPIDKPSEAFASNDPRPVVEQTEPESEPAPQPPQVCQKFLNGHCPVGPLACPYVHDEALRPKRALIESKAVDIQAKFAMFKRKQWEKQIQSTLPGGDQANGGDPKVVGQVQRRRYHPGQKDEEDRQTDGGSDDAEESPLQDSKPGPSLDEQLEQFTAISDSPSLMDRKANIESMHRGLSPQEKEIWASHISSPSAKASVPEIPDLTKIDRSKDPLDNKEFISKALELAQDRIHSSKSVKTRVLREVAQKEASFYVELAQTSLNGHPIHDIPLPVNFNQEELPQSPPQTPEAQTNGVFPEPQAIAEPSLSHSHKESGQTKEPSKKVEEPIDIDKFVRESLSKPRDQKTSEKRKSRRPEYRCDEVAIDDNIVSNFFNKQKAAEPIPMWNVWEANDEFEEFRNKRAEERRQRKAQQEAEERSKLTYCVQCFGMYPNCQRCALLAGQGIFEKRLSLQEAKRINPQFFQRMHNDYKHEQKRSQVIVNYRPSLPPGIWDKGEKVPSWYTPPKDDTPEYTDWSPGRDGPVPQGAGWGDELDDAPNTTNAVTAKASPRTKSPLPVSQVYYPKKKGGYTKKKPAELMTEPPAQQYRSNAYNPDDKPFLYASGERPVEPSQQILNPPISKTRIRRPRKPAENSNVVEIKTPGEKLQEDDEIRPNVAPTAVKPINDLQNEKAKEPDAKPDPELAAKNAEVEEFDQKCRAGFVMPPRPSTPKPNSRKGTPIPVASKPSVNGSPASIVSNPRSDGRPISSHSHNGPVKDFHTSVIPDSPAQAQISLGQRPSTPKTNVYGNKSNTPTDSRSIGHNLPKAGPSDSVNAVYKFTRRPRPPQQHNVPIPAQPPGTQASETQNVAAPNLSKLQTAIPNASETIAKTDAQDLKSPIVPRASTNPQVGNLPTALRSDTPRTGYTQYPRRYCFNCWSSDTHWTADICQEPRRSTQARENLRIQKGISPCPSAWLRVLEAHGVQCLDSRPPSSQMSSRPKGSVMSNGPTPNTRNNSPLPGPSHNGNVGATSDDKAVAPQGLPQKQTGGQTSKAASVAVSNLQINPPKNGLTNLVTVDMKPVSTTNNIRPMNLVTDASLFLKAMTPSVRTSPTPQKDASATLPNAQRRISRSCAFERNGPVMNKRYIGMRIAPHSPISKLPNEVLTKIFFGVLEDFPDRIIRNNEADHIYNESVALRLINWQLGSVRKVCNRWRSLCQSIIYRKVSLTQGNALRRLVQTLKQDGTLAGFIRDVRVDLVQSMASQYNATKSAAGARDELLTPSQGARYLFDIVRLCPGVRTVVANFFGSLQGLNLADGVYKNVTKLMIKDHSYRGQDVDRFWESLLKFPNLEQLVICHDEIYEDPVVEHAIPYEKFWLSPDFFRALQALKFVHAHQLSDDMLLVVAKAARQLRHLDVEDCNGVSSSGMAVALESMNQHQLQSLRFKVWRGRSGKPSKNESSYQRHHLCEVLREGQRLSLRALELEPYRICDRLFNLAQWPSLERLELRMPMYIGCSKDANEETLRESIAIHSEMGSLQEEPILQIGIPHVSLG